MAKTLPAFHSNVCLWLSSTQMLVAPLPERTYICVSYIWWTGSDLPPGAISTTCASLGSRRLGMLIIAPLPPFGSHGESSRAFRSSKAYSTMSGTPCSRTHAMYGSSDLEVAEGLGGFLRSQHPAVLRVLTLVVMASLLGLSISERAGAPAPALHLTRVCTWKPASSLPGKEAYVSRSLVTPATPVQ